MIEAGDRIPSVPVRLVGAEATTETTSDAVLGQGTVVFFTVPGAFTPTCHVNHLPSFLANIEKFRAAKVDRIVCGSTNDHHVLRVWGEKTEALGKVDFLADPQGKLARAMGLDREMDIGLRFRRSAMIVRDGIVQDVFVEEQPGVTATGAPAVLMALQAHAT